MPNPSDTIYALATGSGKSAVAIVRVSGSQSQAILRRICKRRTWPHREAIYASIFDLGGSLIDKAIVLVFDAPRSYTGEDMVEFQITGGRGIKMALLRNLSMCPGTRYAEPGEFARRAFENGKLDLIQVEGLASIVEAETEAEARHSALTAFGVVSRECEIARSELLRVASQLEGFIDFSDIEDPTEASIATVRSGLERSRGVLQALGMRGGVRERLREGYTIAIIGKPNVGKSTLANYLLQRDAAIVSEIPGTTRDYLEFFVEMQGLPIVFVDTAGFRYASDPVEIIGIQKSRDRIRAADLILWLSDANHEIDSFLPKNIDTIKVTTKCDRPNSRQSAPGEILISALTGQGVPELVRAILTRAKQFFDGYSLPGLGSERQISAVSDAIACINRALAGSSQSAELIAEDVRAALDAIGRVTGRVDVEHVLDEVFSRLCIGK